MNGLGNSALDHDFYAYNAANQIWNGTSFVTKVAADFLTYRIAASKISNVNDPAVDEWFHATAPAGTVRYELLERGATLADSPVVWTDALYAETAVTQTTAAAIKSGVRSGLSGRWTNLGTATDRDDISVGDIP